MTCKDRIRFWNKVNKPIGSWLGTECWLWTGGLEKTGYAYFKMEGRRYRVHRLTLIWNQGKSPRNKPLALHSCRNKHCVNPFHLRWGTQKENMADKIKDGTMPSGDNHHNRKRPERMARGVRHGMSKFSDVIVRRIFRAKGTQRSIAAKFDCDQGYVFLVKNRKTRKEATEGL